MQADENGDDEPVEPVHGSDDRPQQAPPQHHHPHTSTEEQSNRRKRIKEIMSDPDLSQHEKSKAVQFLMDGRRRSMSSQNSFHSDESQRYANLMGRAAAQAHDYYSSDDDEADADAIMNDMASSEDAIAPDDVTYGYDDLNDRYKSDERSVASSVTQTSHPSVTHNNATTTAPPSDIPSGLTYRQVHGRSYSLQDWSDRDRAAAAASTNIFQTPAQINRMMEISRPVCTHYERQCTIVSPCCGLAFGCRICHDDCDVLPQPLHLRRPPSSANNEEGNTPEQRKDLKPKPKMDRRRSMPLDLEEEEEHHHAIDRFLIREVICRSCHVRQSSKT
jgi:hypothetical protein